MMNERAPNPSIPAGAVPPPGFWVRDETYAPEPVMPMWRSVFLEPLSAGFEYAFTEMSSLVAAREYRDIGGWMYFSPSWLQPRDPRFLPRLRGFVNHIANQGELRFASLWDIEWQPAQKGQIARLQRVDLAALSDNDLTNHVASTLMPFLRESIKLQALLELVFINSLAKFAVSCQTVLGCDDGDIMALLSGLSKATGEQTRRLSELARLAKANPSTRAFLERIDNTGLEKLTASDPEFASAFEAFLRDFGCRILHHAIHYPTLKERPTLVLGLVHDQLSRVFDQDTIDKETDMKRAASLAHARDILKGRPLADRERFETALRGAEQVYPLKEGGEYDTMDAPMALMRYGLLEMGQRLVRKGRVEGSDDVFFFELDELFRVFHDEDTDARDLVARRKAERTWVAAHPGPSFYGQEPTRPPDGLPPEVMDHMKGSTWVLNHYYGTEVARRAPTPLELQGMAASYGTYTGPARIIMNASDFEKLQPGDVLVARATSPSWAILFPSIGAIVTDAGGILSHCAIVAREYGLPAVVATRTATTVLKDGQRVTVDGTAGTVRIE
jgi:rifampicin phosphotransferase